MRKVLTISFLLLFGITLYAQEVQFEEYDLPNGLHVILHQDNGAPVVTTSVLYHVGAKDEEPQRTGFAHFFEHLLFEGNGLVLFPLTEGKIMPTLTMISLTIMKFSLLTTYN